MLDLSFAGDAKPFLDALVCFLLWHRRHLLIAKRSSLDGKLTMLNAFRCPRKGILDPERAA
jgi:hypothetical protein